MRKIKNEARIPWIIDFKIGQVIYCIGHDRVYHGLYVEQVEIEKFILNYPVGPYEIIWEFGNITEHKNRNNKIGKIKTYKPSDCVETLPEAKKKLEEEMKKISKDFQIKKTSNIENIEGLKEILKLEIQESLEYSRSLNKITNQFKRIDLDIQFIKKVASTKQKT